MLWNKKIKQETRKNRFKAWLILSASLFLSLSFYSYNPQDSSLNSFGISLKVTNYCGFVGASLADLFYQIFGLSSWFFILGALSLSYKFFKNRFQEPLINSFLFFTLFLTSFCGLSALHFPKTTFFQQKIPMGGALGEIFVAGLTPLFHTVGTAIILWSAFLMFFIFYGQTLLPPSLPLSSKNFLWKLILLSKNISLRVWSLLSKGIYLIKSYIKNSFYFLRNRLSFFNHFRKRKNVLPKEPLSHSKNEIFLKTEQPAFAFKEEEALFNKKDLKNPVFGKQVNSQKFNSHLSLQPELAAVRDSEKKGAGSKFSTNKITSLYKLPSWDILSDSPLSEKRINREDVEDLSKKLIDKLAQFSIKGEIKAIKTGPAVVLFEFKPEDHIKVSRIREMESDLSLALSSESIRIIAPIPGKDVVGIEASRPYREMVYLKNLLKEESFFQMSLPLILGRRADNLIGVKDLARIPHLLVAGTTGSGKSIFIISFISSLLFRHSPETLRLLLIDPKQVDLSNFKNIPHLLSPIITSANETVGALQWAITEMEKRYRSMALFGARDNKSFNEKVKTLSYKEKKQHEKINETAPSQESYYFEPLPLICIIIEEFGDLMADRNIRRSVENSVVRLAQKARASGIHLVLAMQSPRKDVVTGLIKTNIPGRISFKVASGTDSRVILDDLGAERLLSHGDMLFLEPGNPKPLRYHGPFIREKDIIKLGNYWKDQGEPLYEGSLVKGGEKKHIPEWANHGGLDIKQDPMYNEILNFVKTCDVVSASFLQRKFRIGYPRAARMIEVLFEEGQIGPPQGSKPREVLINK